MTSKTANYILRNIRLFARVRAQLTFFGRKRYTYITTNSRNKFYALYIW